MLKPIKITIPEDKWEQAGWNDPAAILYCRLQINGCDMHLEAVQVETTWNEEDGMYPQWRQEAVDGAYEQKLIDALALCGDTDVLETVTIAGRKYVLMATSFAR
jgi:hypothetical protein